MENTKILNADLVHHTGSMLRFTTNQLPYLPEKDQYIEVRLPNGREITCKFHFHKANPYAAGTKLIRWIKGIVPFGLKKRVIVKIVSQNRYILLARKTDLSRKREKNLHNTSISGLLRKLLKISKRKSREVRYKLYQKILRNKVNSSLVKKCLGTKCQVRNCEFTDKENREIMKFVSEVHHLEHLAHGGDNSPYNLAVLCANHHTILHRDKNARIVKEQGDDVLITYCNRQRKKWITRDLSALHGIG